MWVPLALCLFVGSCSLLPSEFNLSPIYRHRLDENGDVLEMDVLWPLIHYETLANGGSDFRIRPFYRRVEEPDLPGFDTPETPDTSPSPVDPIDVGPVSFDPEASGAEDAATNFRTDHQFLWPLGRVRVNALETQARLFPLWNWVSREFTDGSAETDWYFLFPFIWGGAERQNAEAAWDRYFGVLPFWLDAPAEFLTYDRLTFFLWPLYTRTEKDGRVGHTFLWPLLGFGGAEDPAETHWYRALPLFNHIARQGEFARYSVLWPFINWSIELIESGDPLHSFNLFPLFGWQKNETITAWSFLWPFFRGENIGTRKTQYDILWPFFHWLEDNTLDRDLKTWWVWPFISRTTSIYRSTWSVLWPIIWWREYFDPDGTQTQQWILPFFKHVRMEFDSGGADDYLQIWPLFDVESRREGTGGWNFPSPWFWRSGYEEGIGEAYDWLYTLARSKTRAPDDKATHLAAHLYTTRTRKGRTQTSVPFLFSYESDDSGSTFYLFNLFPIGFGGNQEDGG